ncbi:peptidase Do [compost metagenome]
MASGDLPALIGQSTPGSTMALEVWRQGQRENLTARLGDASDKKAQVAQADGGVGQGKLGLALRPLQPQEQRQSGVSAGLVVEGVGGPAERAGVMPGDLLVAVNGTPVQNVEQVRAVVAKSPKSVALLIQRDGDTIFVPVRLG